MPILKDRTHPVGAEALNDLGSADRGPDHDRPILPLRGLPVVTSCNFRIATSH